MFRTRAPSAAQAFLCASVLFAVTALATPGEATDISGVRVPTTSGVTHTSADLMQLEAARPPRRGPRPEHELEGFAAIDRRIEFLAGGQPSRVVYLGLLAGRGDRPGPGLEV